MLQAGDSSALRGAGTITPGGLAAVKNAPTLGAPLAYREARRFAHSSRWAGPRVLVRRGPGCAPPAAGPGRRVPGRASEPRRPRQVNAARGGGVARRGTPRRPEVGAAASAGLLGKWPQRRECRRLCLVSGFVSPAVVFRL